ncbi:putative 2-acylglycerol O-acyltransferase [Helianthus anomalus]
MPAFLFGNLYMGALITMLIYFQSDHDMWSWLIFSSPPFVIPEPMVPSKVLSFSFISYEFGAYDWFIDHSSFNWNEKLDFNNPI